MTQIIQVGNRQCIGILFIIPVIVEIHGHRFEIYTLVSEIHENVLNKSNFLLKQILEQEKLSTKQDSNLHP